MTSRFALLLLLFACTNPAVSAGKTAAISVPDRYSAAAAEAVLAEGGNAVDAAIAVAFVLARPGLFLNTSSDATLLRTILEAANEPAEAPPPASLEADVARQAMQPLFVPGQDGI